MSSFLDDTLKVWQPYYDQELSQQDAEEIVANWGAFINVVAEWRENQQGGQ